MRKYRNMLAIMLLLFAVSVHADEPKLATASRFVTCVLVIETGDKPLAAWQVELRYDAATTAIVGLERGGATGYKTDTAPRYDARGLTAGRIKIADFSLADDLPAGSVRVAVLHLELRDGATTLPTVHTIIAATTDGAKFTATATLKEETR